MVWLLILDATIVEMVQRRYTDLVVHALMHALVVVVPIVWLLKTDGTIVVVVRSRPCSCCRWGGCSRRTG